MALLPALATSMLFLATGTHQKIQESVDVIGWTRSGRGAANDHLRVILALENQYMEQLAQEVLAVSSPRSSRYGQHLRPAEIATLTGPAPGTSDAVEAWIRGEGIETRVSRWGDRIEFEATVAQIEKLFRTRMHRYSSNDGRTVLQAGHLYAPKNVARSIAAVFGLHGTPFVRPKAPRGDLSSAAVTPQLLRQQYHVAGGPEVSRNSRNRRATVEFQNQYTTQADLSSFFKQYVLDAKDGDEIYSCYPGHCEPQGREQPGTEAMLDVEYIMGPVPGIKTEVWTFSGSQFCTDLKNWTGHLIDHDDPPLVFSISYGVQGNVSLDKTQGCSEQLSRSIEDDFTKIAARGVTLVFSSGDDGSGGSVLLRSKLWPVWPGSAPHGTTVGATQFVSGSSGEEEAVTSFGSGGGFSWRFAQQPWQKDAVDGYLARKDAGLPRDGDFPRTGRATPEVSALGLGYQVVVAGHTQAIGGTSASAPFFAGLVSYLNEVRLQQGKSPLGFLNPLLHEMAQAGKGFTDVVRGGNRKGRGNIPLREGYSCTVGWDAVTGWGTPKFQEMLEYVQGLPSGTRPDAQIVV